MPHFICVKYGQSSSFLRQHAQKLQCIGKWSNFLFILYSNYLCIHFYNIAVTLAVICRNKCSKVLDRKYNTIDIMSDVKILRRNQAELWGYYRIFTFCFFLCSLKVFNKSSCFGLWKRSPKNLPQHTYVRQRITLWSRPSNVTSDLWNGRNNNILRRSWTKQFLSSLTTCRRKWNLELCGWNIRCPPAYATLNCGKVIPCTSLFAYLFASIQRRKYLGTYRREHCRQDVR